MVWVLVGVIVLCLYIIDMSGNGMIRSVMVFGRVKVSVNFEVWE